MPSSTFKKGGLNQRERVSLIAEIMLEGTFRLMNSSDKKDKPGKTQNSKSHDQKIYDAEKTVLQIQVNPR